MTEGSGILLRFIEIACGRRAILRLEVSTWSWLLPEMEYVRGKQMWGKGTDGSLASNALLTPFPACSKSTHKRYYFDHEALHFKFVYIARCYQVFGAAVHIDTVLCRVPGPRFCHFRPRTSRCSYGQRFALIILWSIGCWSGAIGMSLAYRIHPGGESLFCLAHILW